MWFWADWLSWGRAWACCKASPYADFLTGYQHLTQVGFAVERSPDEAWCHFCGWRVNYEQAAYTLAYQIDAVPALWSGPRQIPEHPIRPLRPPNRAPDRPGT